MSTDPARNTHKVASCGDKIMKNHCYWPLVSDLSNVLSHKQVALAFVSDDGLLQMWFSYLSMYQGKLSPADVVLLPVHVPG